MLQRTSVQFNKKQLKIGKLRINGRNNRGRITVFHRGKGHARIYRVIDFHRYVWDVPGVINSHEYDPNRTAVINGIIYANHLLSYQLAVDGVTVSNVLTNTVPLSGTEDRDGFTTYAKYIRPGSYINTLEFKPFGGAKYIRSGGVYGKLVSLTQTGFAIVKLRSKVLLKVSENCVATIGTLRKWKSLFFPRKNAGSNRRRGFRSTVRGVAMNPIDHPHGGGQGKTSGGRPSVSPWAQITKGLKTRRKISYGAFIMKR